MLISLCPLFPLRAQTNLLLNGGFEDVNTCTEYHSECGVEGWFYLQNIKAQMLANETNTQLLGSNSFGVFYNWTGYTDFIPVVGTLLPCVLQKGKEYVFSGMISAKLNPRLTFTPGLCLGTKFYVPKRPFALSLQPVPLTGLTKIPNTNFYAFRYSFTADGTERYLSFGAYIREDTLGAKKKWIGTQTVSIVLENFELVPADKDETACADYETNKTAVYNYNFRHKEMDYSLFGRGDLKIVFERADSNGVTRQREIPAPPALKITVPDTLKLGDVLFDFNKAGLKPAARELLAAYFGKTGGAAIDSIFIEGHTDSIGSDRQNLELSRLRCETVQAWLQAYPLTAGHTLRIHPYGRSRPVAPNRTPEGRALNRRVEMIIFRKKEG